MAIRIKHKVNVKIANDTDMKDKLFEFDDTLAEVVIDTFQRQNSGKFHIAAEGVEDLPMGDITATKGVVIKFDQDCTIKINGGTDVFSVEKAEGKTFARFFMEGTITAIEVTAILELEGVFCTWGDPTA